jgi:hypothetical protein
MPTKKQGNLHAIINALIFQNILSSLSIKEFTLMIIIRLPLPLYVAICNQGLLE